MAPFVSANLALVTSYGQNSCSVGAPIPFFVVPRSPIANPERTLRALRRATRLVCVSTLANHIPELKIRVGKERAFESDYSPGRQQLTVHILYVPRVRPIHLQAKSAQGQGDLSTHDARSTLAFDAMS